MRKGEYLRQNAILGARKEMDRQYERWGEQTHQSFYWLGILMEEVGEASKAAIEYDGDAYRQELIHVAAVAINMIVCYDAHGAIWR